MPCYASSVRRGRKLVGRSHHLASLSLEISAIFFSPLDFNFFRGQKLSQTIRAYSSQACLKKNRARHTPYFEGERLRWIATVASCRTGNGGVFTVDTLPNPNTPRDQAYHKQKCGNGSLHQDPWIQRNKTSIRNKNRTPVLGTDQEKNSRHQRHLSNRARLRMRPSPPASLALFLDSRTNPSPRIFRALDELDLRNKSWDVTLPGILLRYIFLTQRSESLCPSLSATTTLMKYGFSMEDVKLWAHIVTAPTDEEAARRYLSNAWATPPFILLEILRRPRISVESLRSLVIKSWDISLGVSKGNQRHNIDSDTVDENEASKPSLESQYPLIGQRATTRPLQDNTFTVLIARLLRHARQVWPSAVISITHLAVKYCKRIASNNPTDEARLTPKLHARLCRIYNLVMHRLSLPASLDPLISATYSWYAQRVILETMSDFRPSVELDKRSYQAVSRVLLASKKSPQEEMFSQLIKRSWPPWRKVLDGMDAERSPDQDISRVAAALSLMKQAGFALEPVDKAIGIYGGRESDGTPTIQTRFLKRERSVRVRGTPVQGLTKIRDTRHQWAARITATRDVQEAWAAFSEFNASQQLRPSMSMYHAMYEKLIFNNKHDPKVSESAIPGDGKEVMPIRDNNVSDAEKLRIQPLSLDELYEQMIRDNIRPSGRCIALLIEKASSFAHVEKYLSDSGISSIAVDSLLLMDRPLDKTVLNQIPNIIFAAYIRFLSRLSRLPSNNPIKTSKPRHDRFRAVRSNAFQHALELVKCRQTSNAYAWTGLFQAVVHRGFVLDYGASEDENSIMAWRLLEAVLQDSYDAGARLDPSGLQYICYGLEKVLRSSAVVLENEAALLKRGHTLIKNAFANLARHNGYEEWYRLPRLSSEFAGPNLHAYIRALGLLQDVGEIQAVVKWMVEFQNELVVRAAPRRNGMASLRRTLIATRAFTDYDTADKTIVDDLKDQISKLDGWGGWPSDSELEAYLNHRTCSDNKEGGNESREIAKPP